MLKLQKRASIADFGKIANRFREIANAKLPETWLGKRANYALFSQQSFYKIG
jgi:hypothetical protein